MTKEKEKEKPDEFKKSVMDEFKNIEGVGVVSAEKLYEGGYYSLIDVGAASPSMLSDRTSIAVESASKIVANAMKIADLGKFMNGNERLVVEQERPKLSTGVESLDTLLGGGLYPGIITEMAAENGVGKTQLGFTLAVMATRPIVEGGLDSHVIFIDTENTYRSGRIYMIAEARGYDPQETLDKIHVISAPSSSHQILVMNDVRKLSAELGGVKLIIVDSVIANFRSEFTGRGTLAERQQLLGKHLSDLSTFSTNNDAVVYVTNQVSARPDAFFGDPNNPTGGNIMGHDNANRLWMRKGKQLKRVIKLVKSPDRPVGECVVELSDKGVEDA